MTPGLLLPLGLTALTALALPVILHIARRTETRVIEFAALRWLRSRPRPRLRPVIDERWLLAVRLLLLALLALWLARPVLWGAEDRRPVVAVAPGIDAGQAGAAADARRIWLAPGFPEADGAPPPPSDALVSLIRQLDSELPPGAPLEIVVPAVLDGADAERPRLSRVVRWRTVPAAGPAPQPAPAPPPLSVRFSDEAANGVRYLRAAAAAWTAPGGSPAFDAAAVDHPPPPQGHALAWLAAGPPTPAVVDWTRRGGTLLLPHDARLETETEPTAAWSDETGAPLALAGRLGRGRVVRLTQPLDPAAVPPLLEPDFPEVLLALLAPSPPPARVAAADHAPLTGAPAGPPPALDLRPALGLAVALIFALERWLATRRRRGIAP